MTEPTLWNQLLIWPIINILVVLYRAFEWLRFPGALGFAVVALTVIIRLVLSPVMAAQMKSARKLAKLKPQMDALAARHKNDKQALQQAQLDLYKSNGVNPAAGCLPMLIQLPVLIALYNVFYQVLGNGDAAKMLADINAVLYVPAMKLASLDMSFFGTNLGVKPSQWQSAGAWLLLVPVITAALQWWQSKLMLPPTPPAADITKLATKSKDENDKKPEDTAAEMQKQMAMITPVMFGMFAYQFPLGLALYWNVFGLFGIIQQMKINKD